MTPTRYSKEYLDTLAWLDKNVLFNWSVDGLEDAGISVLDLHQLEGHLVDVFEAWLFKIAQRNR